MNQTTDEMCPMTIDRVHVICDALIKFLEQNDELNDRDSTFEVCESVVRLMLDIYMVIQM